jgi:prepilin-type N-terminal cleavage/methylation domain-containing protein/prepilin-type processing-associated H-X9-DG protein
MKRSAFTLIELLVAIGIVGVLVGLLIPAIQAVRESARNTSCKNNLRQIAIAVFAYESSRESFPPGQIAGTSDSNGNFDNSNSSMLGHLGFLFPYLEFANFWDQFVFEPSLQLGPNAQPWYSHQVLAVAASEQLSSFRCPADPQTNTTTILVARRSTGTGEVIGSVDFASPHKGWTNYIGSSGTVNQLGSSSLNAGVFYENSKVVFSDITDGTSNTILIGEITGGFDVGGLRSRNSIFQNGLGAIHGLGNDPSEWNDTSSHLKTTFSSFHYGGTHVNFAMCDGSVRTIEKDADYSTMNSLFTRNGGEVVHTE